MLSMECLAGESRFGSGLCSRMQKRLMRMSKWVRINYRSATNVRCETICMKFLSVKLTAFVIVAEILCGCSVKTPKPEDVVEGASSPEFSLMALDGATFRISSLKGKVVIMNCW